MGVPRERDIYNRPLCSVCGEPIRRIEDVPGPEGRSVHFYCLAAARARQARGGNSDESAA
jgi:hypothetical protein